MQLDHIARLGACIFFAHWAIFPPSGPLTAVIEEDIPFRLSTTVMLLLALLSFVPKHSVIKHIFPTALVAWWAYWLFMTLITFGGAGNLSFPVGATGLFMAYLLQSMEAKLAVWKVY